MINTLQRIGNIIRNDSVGRVKYHPLISSIDITDKNNKKIQYDVYEIYVDTINKTMSIPLLIPSTSFKVLKYDVGGKNFPYIIGNFECVNTGKKTDNKILSCLNNIKTLNITDSLFEDYANIIDNNSVCIKNIIDNVQIGDGIIFNIKINGQEFYDDINIMNVIDDTYINNITTSNTNNNLLLTNSLFGFFNTNKKISQCPNFSFDESDKSFFLNKSLLNDLIYSVKFHSTKLKYIINDYMFTYLPNFESLTYDILDNQITNKTLNSVVSNISSSRSNTMTPCIDDLLNCGLNGLITSSIKDEVSFDIIFKLKGGNTTSDILLLRNFKLTKLEKLNDKVYGINKKLNSNDYQYNIKYAFEKFFKKETETKTKSYGSFIVKWIIEIFQDNYYTNTFLKTILIQKIEYSIRNNSEIRDITNEYNNITKNYKFLKYMEKNGENEEMKNMNSDSYKLGNQLGEFCKTWQKDRKNLVKFIQNFNGQISRRIRSLKDVNVFLSDFCQRLEINKSYIDKTKFGEIKTLREKCSDKLDIQLFIIGYFDGQYSYNKKEITE